MKSTRYSLNKSKYLLEDEQTELNRILEKFQDKHLRDTTLIWTALFTGARASELLAVTAADLDPKAHTVYIIGLKGSDSREIPLPAWLFAKVMALAPDVGRVFPISYPRFHQIWQLYRPCKKNIHALRHSFAINVYRKTKDILLVKTALGHRSLANTMIYADYQYKTNELRKIL